MITGRGGGARAPSVPGDLGEGRGREEAGAGEAGGRRVEGAGSVVGTCAQGCGCSRLQGRGGRVSAGGRAGQSDRRCLASLGLMRVLYDMARCKPGTPPWTLPLKSPLQMPEWTSVSAWGPRGRGRKATGLWLTGGPGPAQRGDPSWLPRGSGQTSEPSAARGVSQTLSVHTQSPEIQGPFSTHGQCCPTECRPSRYTRLSDQPDRIGDSPLKSYSSFS